MIGRIRALALATGFIVAAMPGTASAHDHKPPRTVLTAGRAEQRGQLGTHCWTSAGEEPGEYQTICADYMWTFPDAVRAPAGGEATITIYKTTAAEELDIRRYRHIGDSGHPEGDGKEVDYKVAPASVDGKTVYEVTFTLPSRPGHMYLDLFGIWQDTEGADQPQDANYTFHFKLH